MRPPDDGHEWISLQDNDGSNWLFDITFLLSNYQCIYGNGCQSITTDPDGNETLGCCSHGAHLVDDEDRESVANYSALLTDDDWQHRRQAVKKGGPIKKTKKGAWKTRKVDGACIFLNRSDFHGGAGCALHRAATKKGERPLDWKPDVCWQVPIRLDIHTDDYDNETIFVKAWERQDWGPGGEDFHWWCIEEDQAYGASWPVYKSAKEELIEMVGEDVYDRLAQLLYQRQAETSVSIT